MGRGAWLGRREVASWELTGPPRRVNGELRMGVVALSPHSQRLFRSIMASGDWCPWVVTLVVVVFSGRWG